LQHMKSVGGHCKACESSKTSNPYIFPKNPRNLKEFAETTKKIIKNVSTSVKSYRNGAVLNVNAAVLNAIDVLNLNELILDDNGQLFILMAWLVMLMGRY